MKKTITLSILCFLFVFSMQAQNYERCAAMENLEYRKTLDPTLENRMAEIEAFTQQKVLSQQNYQNKISGSIITIPVVVHVLYRNSTENISIAQIQSQLDVLNEDFRRTNPDADNSWSQAADTQIEFCLSTVDPNGNATTGITRKQTTRQDWNANDDAKRSSSGGIDPWNTSEYLNMWVVPKMTTVSQGQTINLLGYAQFPGGAVATDGIIMIYNAFGRTGAVTAPYDGGRTTTHEIGHYFNLRHIWGDSNCGNDFVSDTPTHQTSNSGCPIGQTSCGSTDMPQNYMDYTNDSCMNLFTQGQKTRMRAVLDTGGARRSLALSDKCGAAAQPTCTDGIQNGTETGVDCGGSCTPCQTGPQYCASQGNSVTDEYISKVQVGSINNSSGAQLYSDFTSISTNLTKGATNSITITPTWTGTVYSEGFAVWIDYNQDGDFTDSGEQVFSKAASQETTASGSFTVPTSASFGATRMRISMKYNGTPTSCETFSYGEVEDYTVNIGAGVADTVKPVITLTGVSTINLEVGNTYTELGATATDNVDGNLTPSIVITGTVNTNTAGTYTRYYNVSDAAGNAATQQTRTVVVTQPADTTAPVITLNGASTINLEVGDTYTELGATATDNVDGNLTSSIVASGTVNTNVAGTYTRNYNVSDTAGNAAVQVSRSIIITQPSTGSGCTGAITSFPYNEGFENTLGSWSQDSGDDFNWTVDASGTPSSNTGPSSASEGSYYIYMESSAPNYSTKRAILNSPCFDLSAATQVTFEFKYHMYGTTAMGSLALEVSSNNGSIWISVWSKSGNQGNTWATATVDLSSYVGNAVQLRFNGVTGTTWQGDMAVDAVNLSTGGSSNPACSNVNLSLTFDNYPEETAWSIVNSSGQTVASGGTYGSQVDGSTLNTSIGCLDDGCYDFVITDVYGDGICCTYGNGSYTLTNSDSGTTIASGGSFASSQITNFCLGTSGFNYSLSGLTTNVDNTGKHFKLYPNPVKDQLKISLIGFEAQSFKIINMLGQSVLQGRYKDVIDVTELQDGVYILQVNIGEKTKFKKFIKQ